MVKPWLMSVDHPFTKVHQSTTATHAFCRQGDIATDCIVNMISSLCQWTRLYSPWGYEQSSGMNTPIDLRQCVQSTEQACLKDDLKNLNLYFYLTNKDIQFNCTIIGFFEQAPYKLNFGFPHINQSQSTVITCTKALNLKQRSEVDAICDHNGSLGTINGEFYYLHVMFKAAILSGHLQGHELISYFNEVLLPAKNY